MISRSRKWTLAATPAALLLVLSVSGCGDGSSSGSQAGERGFEVMQRSDVRALPAELKARLAEMADRPSTYPPITAFSEADSPSQLFQHYLLDSSKFEPNVFTAPQAGINDQARPTSSRSSKRSTTRCASPTRERSIAPSPSMPSA